MKQSTNKNINNGLNSATVISFWIALSPLVVLLIAGFSVICFGDIAKFCLMSEHIYFYFIGSIIIFLSLDLYRIITRQTTLGSFKESIKLSPEIYILLGFLVWNVVATLLQKLVFGSSLAYTTIIHPLFIQEGLFAFFVYAICLWFGFMTKNQNTIKNVLIALLVSGVVTCIIAILDPHNTFAVQAVSNVPWAGLFINSNHFGYFLVILSTISAGLFLFEEKKWLKYIFLFCLVLFCITSCLVDCLGSIIATLAVFAVMPIIISLKDKKFSLASLLPLGIFLISSIVADLLSTALQSYHKNIFSQIWGLLSDARTIVSAPGSESAAAAGTNRWGLWLDALNEILSSPIIGTGNVLARPHNEYLQFALVWGLPSLVIYITAFVVMFIKTIKKFNHHSPLTLILGFGVLGYLISAIFGNTMPHTAPFFALILGFFIRSLNSPTENKI